MTTYTAVEVVCNFVHEGHGFDKHGHDYIIRAVFVNTGVSFDILKGMVRDQTDKFDHAPFAGGLWSAEDMAKYLRQKLDCFRVEVNRPWLGHFAWDE